MPKLIDVDELRDWVTNWFKVNKYYHPHSRTNSIPTSELYDILERMPIVDAEPVRHGRWLKNGDRYCECSVCHHEGNTSGADNYCWFCGAKMDEVEEDADK